MAAPSGLALDEAHNRLYVMNRFDHTISIVSNIDAPSRAETGVVPLPYDPSPTSVQLGRSLLYDARRTSGHGDSACASCHIFGDFDSLAWDLGDPFGDIVNNPNPFINAPSGDDFHPLKGPMTTQSLRGMADAGPMHWRGDRTEGNDPGGDPLDEDAAFKKFNPAFVGLLGRAAELSAADMQAFTDFILTVHYPPNPIRALDNVATAAQAAGENFYRNSIVDGPRRCNDCHALPLGTGGLSSFEGEPQQFKVAHLRNQYQKIGMFGVPPIGGNPGTGFLGDQVRGFGFLHDGSVATVFNFLQAAVFNFPNNGARRNVEQFLFALDTGLRPAVGQQVSTTAATIGDPAVIARLNLLTQRDDAGDCDLVVKAIIGGEVRGLLYNGGGTYRNDRAAAPPMSEVTLRSQASAAGQEQVYTCVPPGAGTRIGLDRDEDGFFDRDELDAGSDPADPASVPSCATTPLAGCRAPGRTLLQLKADSGREKLTWKWLKGEPTDLTALGDPVAGGTTYSLCIYAGTTATRVEIPSNAACPECWTPRGSSGFKYRNGALTPDGIKLATLKAGETGKAKIIVKGSDGNLPISLPAAGLPLPVTVQLSNDAGECWEAIFTSASRNDASQFKAKQ